MSFNRIILSLSIILCFSACKSQADFNLETPTKIQINQPLNVSISTPLEENTKITYFLDGKEIGSGSKTTVDITNYRLGKHILKASIGENNDVINKEKEVIFLASTKPKVYGYKVINTYPHDREAFTQGLEFHNNELYEGTGQRGKSVLRKVDLETGKVLKEQPLTNKYFGEGITIFNNKVYQLTWQGGIGFIYDVDTFKTLKTFNYNKSKEGWGLTHNDTHLIKSDGTEKIWFLNPENGQEESYIEVYTNKRRVEELNELEYVNGEIYANIWMKNAITIINPKNGTVKAIINLNGLTDHLDNKTIAQSQDKVLNGIAYNPNTNKLYVTGKNWDKLFEIEIVK
ncbi:glutaminyl-peptide cyclotransferase [Wenyingzhuangia sp. chi5]|uniref:Glutaminyl-peptide cyclotransferase n=1 Tax=Wenyingzhuangia gilva TaxID=3057677 RepID=A0ABT8VRC9_9FLAO|nr:glutaminyl-peptide cyclotransferase [Wenyingzhuangia sp. chi5]MDO3694509.1 glutaminyl-peptide cyclotransferase [Wenyingzhuangia sp. chi5]